MDTKRTLQTLLAGAIAVSTAGMAGEALAAKEADLMDF